MIPQSKINISYKVIHDVHLSLLKHLLVRRTWESLESMTEEAMSTCFQRIMKTHKQFSASSGIETG